jgi:hypothetical protein
MKRYILALLLLLITSPAFADGSYWVAKTGTDMNNDCRNQAAPCLTIQHAVDQIGAVGSINVGDGTYTENIAINYYRFVGITGNCANPGAVMLKATGIGAIIIAAQDHSTAVVGCMDFATDYTGATAVSGRQHVIIDYGNVRFNGFPGGAHVSVTVANCGGTIWVLGSPTVHAAANNNSTVHMGCPHYIVPLSFTVFLAAQYKSVIFANSMTISGGGSSGSSLGRQCSVVDATILLPPGGVLPGNIPCESYAAAPNH